MSQRHRITYEARDGDLIEVSIIEADDLVRVGTVAVIQRDNTVLENWQDTRAGLVTQRDDFNRRIAEIDALNLPVRGG